MELFTVRVGLRLINSSARFSRNIRRSQNAFFSCEKRLCLPEGPKLGATLFVTHGRLSFANYILKTERTNCHNLRSQRRLYSDKPTKDCDGATAAVKKPNIFQKMKQMTKDYWHILVPVHVVTSIGWILIFYTAAKNSVDVIWIMERLRFSDRYVDALRGSSAGYWAVAYALYKICTPVRYMVTVGGTTLSIKYLRRMGYLKTKLRASPAQKSPQVEYKENLGKLGCKDGQRQADPPKT